MDRISLPPLSLSLSFCLSLVGFHASPAPAVLVVRAPPRNCPLNCLPVSQNC